MIRLLLGFIAGAAVYHIATKNDKVKQAANDLEKQIRGSQPTKEYLQ